MYICICIYIYTHTEVLLMSQHQERWGEDTLSTHTIYTKIPHSLLYNHVYIYVYIYVCIYIHINTDVLLQSQYLSAGSRTHKIQTPHTLKLPYSLSYDYIYIYICICMFICIYVYVYVYIYIYIYIYVCIYKCAAIVAISRALGQGHTNYKHHAQVDSLIYYHMITYIHVYVHVYIYTQGCWCSRNDLER